MSTSTRRIIGVMVCAVCVIAWGSTAWTAGTDTAQDPLQPWTSIGKIGAQAVKLKVWAGKPDGSRLKAGDPIFVRLKCSKKTYVTVIYVSSEGDATVLFPNKDHMESLCKPGKDYTLFGQDSGVKLTFSEKTKKGKIILYASSKPLEISSLKIPAGQACLVIPHTDAQNTKVLVGKLQDLSKDEGFNRKVLALRSRTGKGSIGLMGLPRGIKSSKPEGIAGVQGLKSKVGESDRK
jgi:hypothetical protein